MTFPAARSALQRPILVGDEHAPPSSAGQPRPRAPASMKRSTTGAARRRLDLRLRLADLAARSSIRSRTGRPPSTAGTARWRCARGSIAARRNARAWCSRWSRAARAAAAPTGSSSARVEDELRRLWAREMPNGIYDPKWLACRTPQGVVRGLAFTLEPAQPEPHRPGDRRADGRDPAHRQRPLRQHPRLSGGDGDARCATAASATATSSGWSTSPAATRSRPSGRRRRGAPTRPAAASARRGRGVQVVLGVDVDQDAGIVELDAEGRIAGDDAARAFVAARARCSSG